MYFYVHLASVSVQTPNPIEQALSGDNYKLILIHVIRSLSTLDLYLDLMKTLLNSYNVENCLRVQSQTAASYVVCVMA